MAYTTINKSNLHFNTKLYTGNGSTQSITGVGFQPDWVWIKERNDGSSHAITDAVRGNTKYLSSNTSSSEDTESDRVTGFDSDGFSLGGNVAVNQNTILHASWNWKAGGGQGTSNTDGSINTTYTSVNTTAGFSISSYTGNATSGATVGHGLGTTPAVIIVKKRSGSDGWVVYHHRNTSAPETEYLRLDTTAATADNLGEWNDTAPTSSVFYVGNSGRTNDNGATYIAYCFAEKTGYSKFGSYVGNGNADGTFIYTGFKPAWVLVKKSSSTGHWVLIDNKRDPINVKSKYLLPDDAGVEASFTDRDFLSNGFKMRNSNTDRNGSGATYIYMAFAEAPLVGTNNVPCNAK